MSQRDEDKNIYCEKCHSDKNIGYNDFVCIDCFEELKEECKKLEEDIDKLGVLYNDLKKKLDIGG